MAKSPRNNDDDTESQVYETETDKTGLTSPLPEAEYQSEQFKAPSAKSEPAPEPVKVTPISELGIGPQDPYPTDSPPEPRGPEIETTLGKE